MIGENSGRGRGVWPGLLVGVAGRMTGGEVGRLLTSLSRLSRNVLFTLRTGHQLGTTLSYKNDTFWL